MAFDYRQFLAENKLTKVSKGRETGKAQILSEGLRLNEGFDTGEEMDEANKQKEDYLKRQERAKKGNWKGSIGAFVEEHGEELGNMISKNRDQLKDYVENVMKPELTDEAKQKVDELLDSKKSTFGFIQSLYNFTLKGSGMGLHETEEPEDMEEFDDTMDETKAGSDEIKDTLRMLRNHFKENGLMDFDGVSLDFKADGTVDMYVDGNLHDTIKLDAEEEETEDEMLSEATEQKYKGTPQEKGSRTGAKGYKGKKAGQDQDKMAKSEMTGEKMDVTINGITKSISKQAWTRYRKMTDPEEKKAWREKHGFDKK